MIFDCSRINNLQVVSNKIINAAGTQPQNENNSSNVEKIIKCQQNIQSFYRFETTMDIVYMTYISIHFEYCIYIYWFRCKRVTNINDIPDGLWRIIVKSRHLSSMCRNPKIQSTIDNLKNKTLNLMCSFLTSLKMY